MRLCDNKAEMKPALVLAQIAVRPHMVQSGMYTQFFGLAQPPFSISPDPRYLFMSDRHREALAHLLYGVNSGGGLVLLTGDIGTGKTTVCRCFLEQLPADCNLAYIFNPKLTVHELLQSICDEFRIAVPGGASLKDYIDALNRYLLDAHAAGRNSVLVIDEAQNLSADVLEQLRLLTNLETNERKLLQIILIGQPELRTLLERPELTQLAQRVLAHFHLTALSERETASYIQHRLATAGLASASPLQQQVMKQVHRLTSGVPRHINLLCDRAMLGAYARGTREVSREIVEIAARELFISRTSTSRAQRRNRRWKHVAMGALGASACAAVLGTTAWTMNDRALRDSVSQRWAVAADKVAALLPSIPAAIGAVEAETTPATPAMPQISRDVPSEIEVSVAAPRSEEEAIAQLATLWGLTPDGNPCESDAGRLRCHRSNGGIAELRQLDRPAVLALYDEAGQPPGQPRYALLTALTADKAMLGIGNQSRSIAIGELMRQFRGEFVTLWLAPPNTRGPIDMGDRGEHVDWVAAQLASLNGFEPPSSGRKFDAEVHKLVRLFQRAQGLFVDGVAGPITLMHLNRAAGVSEPRLLAYKAME